MHFDKSGNLILGPRDGSKAETINRSIGYRDGSGYENYPHFFEDGSGGNGENRQILAAAAALLEAGVDPSEIDFESLKAMPLKERLESYRRKLEALALFGEKNKFFSALDRRFIYPAAGELNPVVVVRADELEDVQAALEGSVERFAREDGDGIGRRSAELLGEMATLQGQTEATPAKA